MCRVSFRLDYPIYASGVKIAILVSPQKCDYFYLLVQGQGSNLSGRKRSLPPPELSHFSLNFNGGHNPGSVTCSWLSLLHLVLGPSLFKVAFGKHFVVYFVTCAIMPVVNE